jgi:hypothetical protein
MGRKHKSSCVKNINRNLVQENENLTKINESLRRMSNYSTVRDIESRKKIVELEKCNHSMIEIMKMQRSANDYQQQKIELLETQLSLLNDQESSSITHNQEINSFGSALMLACSIKVDNTKNDDDEINGDGKIKICEEGEKDEDSKMPILF